MRCDVSRCVLHCVLHYGHHAAPEVVSIPIADRTENISEVDLVARNVCDALP